MNYYDQLEKIVLPYLKSYETDLTTHDKANLEGYKGRFFYEYRPSGTCMFRVDFYLDALKEIFNTGKTECFNKRAHFLILSGNYSLLDTYAYSSVTYNWDHDDKYLIGAKGKIKKSTLDQIKTEVRRIDLDEVQPLVTSIRMKWGFKRDEFYPYEWGLQAII